MENQLLLTIDEAAATLSLGKTKTRELIDAGLIESVRVGKARRVPAQAVADFVDRLRAASEVGS